MRVRSWIPAGARTVTMLFGVLALALGGCGSLSGGLHSDALSLAAPPSMVAAATPDEAIAPARDTDAVVVDTDAAVVVDATPVERVAVTDLAVAVGESVATPAAFDIASIELLRDEHVSSAFLALEDSMMVAQAPSGSRPSQPPLDAAIEEYDPWESFNESMFTFNRNLDKFVLKPAAQAYNFVVPDELQQMIDRGFENIRVVPRVVNNLLQAKWAGAGREIARFLINSVVGIGGLWDMAKQEWGIERSKEDFGQTLGVWGAGPGPYLVLPLLPPMTIRDGIGTAVDGAMDPLSYFLPFIWERFAMKAGDIVNDRSLNLELFEGVEETTVDLYTAVRNAYLQRRARQIKE
ncbi:MAG: VacJ family lipoprotein [Candidatus Rokubacteria bacterium]|nr:VacJ family lipoprotein [Candidatus Rokubacteria bacterium]